MKRSSALGAIFYLVLTASILGGVYVGFRQIVGPLNKTTLAEAVLQQGPVARTSGKWTPVEIKRETAPIVASVAPPLYAAAAKKAALAQVAERRDRKAKRRVAVARRRVPEPREALAYAHESQRTFGPFGF